MEKNIDDFLSNKLPIDLVKLISSYIEPKRRKRISAFYMKNV